MFSVESLFLDFQFTLRRFRNDCGFQAAVIATLAVAIGVAASTFAVFYAVLIRPLPYNEPEKIVAVQPFTTQGYSPASYDEYLEWRDRNEGFSAIAGYSTRETNFLGPNGPVAIKNIATSDNFFNVFSVSPMLGRAFAAGEDQPGRNDIVVLSYEVWKTEFHQDRNVIGQNVKLGEIPYTVIGVMPAGFRFPVDMASAVYTPLHLSRGEREGGGHWLPTVARLKPGVSLAQAEADINRIIKSSRIGGRQEQGRGVRLYELTHFLTGTLKSPLYLLLFAVFALLAIGCVNVAGLFLARSLNRERDLSLRIAIGASRQRVVQQTLVEAITLGFFGSSAGGFLAWLFLMALRPLLLSVLPLGLSVKPISAGILLFLGVGILATCVAALFPAWRETAISPLIALKSETSVGATRSQNRIRSAFLVMQIVLAFVLLVTSGLAMRKLKGLENTTLGFDPDGIITTEITLPAGAYEKRDVLGNFYTPLLDRVQSIPGVKSAGLIQLLPVKGWGFNMNVHVVGKPPEPPQQKKLVGVRLVSSGYFTAMGIPLLKGRMLNEKVDTPDSNAAVVNDAFVKQFFAPGEDPIGKQLDVGLMIVGVVGSVRQSLYEPPFPEICYLTSQTLREERFQNLSNMQLVIRTNSKDAAIVPSLRKALHDTDPTIPLRTPLTMREIIDDLLVFERLQNWLFGVFATLAVLLAVVGLYGLISHEVAASTREIGIRMALGSSRLRVMGEIYRRVGLILVSGVSIGAGLIFLLRNLLSSVARIQDDRDFITVVILASIFILIGMFAAFIPVRRAVAVDPVTALRYQ